MADLAAEARQLLTGTPVSFEWMPRSSNSRADRIANEAMDKKQSFMRGAAGEEKRTVRFE
jgi:probable phosphoglycerate mutase